MFLAGFLGLSVAVGIILIVVGIVAPEPSANIKQNRLGFDFQQVSINKTKGFITTIRTSRQHQVKLFLAIFLAFAFYIATNWPAAGLFGIVVGWVGPDISATFSHKKKSLVKIEAYEAWVSQIAHLINAGNHVISAINLSLGAAPEVIREDLSILVAQTEIQGLAPALDQFAERSCSPYADQIVLGIKVAYEGGTKVAEVLRDLNDVFRNEIEVTKRAESSRQLANTQILLSLGISFLLVVMLVVVNRGYLEPFDSIIGQLVMTVAAALFSAALIVVRKYSIVGVKSRLIVDSSYLAEDKEYQKKLRADRRSENKERKRIEKEGLEEYDTLEEDDTKEGHTLAAKYLAEAEGSIAKEERQARAKYQSKRSQKEKTV